MLIKTDAEFYQLSWGVILPVVGLAAAFSLFIVGMGVRALRRAPVTASCGAGRPEASSFPGRCGDRSSRIASFKATVSSAGSRSKRPPQASKARKSGRRR